MNFRSGLDIGVAKVDELLAICDALKESINESQVTQLNLADALVEGVVVDFKPDRFSKPVRFELNKWI